MKGLRLLVGLGVVTAAMFVAANVAGAENGATTTHFTAAYDNGRVGFFTCVGERIVKTGPKGFVKDSETCTTSGGTRFPPDGTYVQGPGDWYSDFDYFVNGTFVPDVSGTITVTNTGPGTSTWTIVAYF